MNATVRGGAVIVLTVLAAYAVGRPDAPANRPPATPAGIVRSTVAEPVAFSTTTVGQATSAPQSTPRSEQKPASDVPSKTENKRKVEAVLTAAAIAAIIVQASRNEYYATGHPCACPDDVTRNGRSCGNMSAYIRPGGAHPLCSAADVTPGMIDDYRKTKLTGASK